MEAPNQRDPKSNPTEAEVHIKSAHQILKPLPKKIGEHPEIGAAITKLEMALNDLAVQTGGLLKGMDRADAMRQSADCDKSPVASVTGVKTCSPSDFDSLVWSSQS